MRVETAGYHHKKVSRALIYIQGHLNEDLRLDDVAGVAFSAPSHFHVMFRNVVGEPLHSYVRGLRLHWAAHRLISTEQTILSVALEFGYESHEAFTRTFRKHFGTTPSTHRRRFRRNGTNGKAFYLATATGSAGAVAPPAAHANGADLNRLLPSGKLAYVSFFGRYNDRHLAWQKLASWLSANGLSTDGQRPVGIVHDLPDVSASHYIRYDAGVLIDPTTVIANDIGVQWLSGCACIVARHNGPQPLTHNTYVELVNNWVLKEARPSCQLLPFFEVYEHFPSTGHVENCAADILVGITT